MESRLMATEINKIQNILESKFSMENYVVLIEEVFSSAKIVSPYKQKSEYSNFTSHIVGYNHVADYVTPDGKSVLILAVELQKESYVENSRSTQRSYAKKLIESNNNDAAIIAFYTKNDSKWRLSYVRLDYDMKFEAGRLKAEEKITPAKRYSFLVGEDEPSHTAIERLYLFISDKNAHPTLNDLDEIFSVEKVTKEFFNLYCEKYHELRECLLENEDFLEESERCGFTVEQFAKKLMGQIVFLYFLQKKGWLGVGAWPETLTEKEYRNIFYTKGAQGKLIKDNLPKVYIKNEDEYILHTRALYHISPEAEEVIANNIPQNVAAEKRKNWGDGSKRFLRGLFEFYKKHDVNGNFYNDYLEPLFYDTLNKNRGNMGYSTLLHCRIPFLSGGLFEPINGYDWQLSDLRIPDEIFSNRDGKVENIGDGILDIFDRYNFTMSEDEPMEREVAIDPEMLGKVFENLLDVTDRKSKGAFYTPREIVHYMCQESLINYLTNTTRLEEEDIRDLIIYGDFMKDEDTVKEKRLGNSEMFISEDIFKVDRDGTIVVNRLNDIDEALKDIRIADPAVGSGAFPVGMLNEIVRARQTLTEYMAIVERTKAVSEAQANKLVRNLRSERNAYDLKKYTIQNSIFAVDIEPSAVDIAQLRLWLSLVIDDEINPSATNILEGHRNPLPLPNLECNILCGNSLVDEFEGYPLLGSNEDIATNYEGQAYSLFQNEYDAVISKILETQNLIFNCNEPLKKEQLLKELSSLKDTAIESQLFYMSPETRERYEATKDLTSKPYILWQLEFAKVFKEKGGFDVVIGNPPYIQLQKTINEDTGEKMGDQYQNLGFSTFAKTGDIYCLFYEKGYQLLHKNGVLSFITSNKWMRAGYGEKLRAFLANKTNPMCLIDFAGQKVFESATVDVNILILTKQTNQHRTIACVAKEASLDNLSVFIKQNRCIMNFQSSESWPIFSPVEQAIKRKIDAVGTPLRDWDISINYGIKTGCNEAFIINGAKKDELIAADPNSAEIIRPILRGKDVKRYNYDFADLWLINVHNGIKKDAIPAININDYPAVKAHLDKYYDKLCRRSDKGDTPYNLRNCVYMDDFSKQKIVWGNLCLSAQFAFVDEDLYINAPSPMIVPGNKYLLAILNSSIGDWYIRQLGVTRNGGYFEYKPMFIEQLPVPQISLEAQAPFIEIVDNIISAKKDHMNTSNLEAILNNMVYILYSLTDNEIKYIESFSQ